MKTYYLRGFALFGALNFVLFFNAYAENGITEMDAAQFLDEHFAPLIADDDPACAFGVARNGQLLASHAAGMANMEHKIAATTDMVFRIGSTSKQFTATSAAILARRGELNLQADISAYLPDMPILDPPITVEHLVYHSSGLPDPYDALVLLTGDVDGNRYPASLTLRMARNVKTLNSEPGSRYEYSNIGYLLLAEIVEKVSGQSLRQFARENIFRPMGMHNTHFHDNAQELVPGRVSAYSRSEDGSNWEWRHSIFDEVGDGGVFSTLADLARWYDVYRDPSALEGGRDLLALLLTPGKYTEQSPQYLGRTMSYGFGVQIYDDDQGRMIGHPGGWAGYASAPFYFPDSNVAVIALCGQKNIDVLKRVVDAEAYLRGAANP